MEYDATHVTQVNDNHSEHDADGEQVLHCVHCHVGHYKTSTNTVKVHRNIRETKKLPLTLGNLYKSPLFGIVRPPRS